MLRLALQAEHLSHLPHIPKIEVNNVRQGFFEPSELKAVLEDLPSDLRAVVRFAAMTGWRKSEILSLCWRQVDFGVGMVRLEPGTTKNNEGRSFPFTALPALETLLVSQREATRAVERKENRIVVNGFHRNGKPIRDMRRSWDAACERAGVPGRWFHDLRRTAVRNLERAGVSRSVAMKLTGHRSEAVFRRYAIVAEQDLRDGVRKLSKLHPLDVDGTISAQIGGVGQ